MSSCTSPANVGQMARAHKTGLKSAEQARLSFYRNVLGKKPSLGICRGLKKRGNCPRCFRFALKHHALVCLALLYTLCIGAWTNICVVLLITPWGPKPHWSQGLRNNATIFRNIVLHTIKMFQFIFLPNRIKGSLDAWVFLFFLGFQCL